MRFPLISVIVTTYNYAHTVGTAIRSVLAQDYPNLEVLVLDNASTDATQAVVRDLARDRRVRYHRHPTNIGMVRNHNAGLRMAKGRYVSFLSADDFLMPGFLSRSFAFLQAHPEIDVRYGSTYFVDPHERFSGIRQMAGQPLFAYEGGRNEFASLLAEGCYMCFPTMLVRRDLYERFGPLDESITAADYDIVLRWAERGVRFAYDPEPVVGVRLHPHQQSSVQNYVADGTDLKEILALIRRFTRPGTEERIAGFERRIAAHARSKLQYGATYNPGLKDDAELAAGVEACAQMLDEVRRRNLRRPRRNHPTVIVLAGRYAAPLDESLQSLLAQTHAEWEAIVVQAPGPAWAPLVRYRDPGGRVRSAAIDRMLPDGARLNQALRIAKGNVFAFMRAGTVWPPGHLQELLAVFERNEVFVGFSRAALAVEQINGPHMTMRRRVEMCYGLGSWPRISLLRVAPDLPLDALAFRIEALDQVGAFNEASPVFEDWEMALRLSACGAFAPIDSEVELRTVLGFADRDVPLALAPSIAKAIHAAYPDLDPYETALRAELVRDLQSLAEAAKDPRFASAALANFSCVAAALRLRHEAATA
jgi:glycosyltransferase involved in cell wall biosynthesis